MSTQARIERISAETAHHLAEVAEGVFDAPLTPERLAAVLARPEHLLFVARDGELVVGQCLAMVLHGPDRDPALYIDNLGVAEVARRRGIGTALMQAALAAGRDMGCAWIWLGSDPDSASAKPFYQALGLSFRQVEYAEAELN
ncbi:GNAT family N-acetyltransferase [Pseudooceanicola sp.]|uniref:GNAT family N-acetyltransferase n=1 Tax=Pseudooceanicola sp. TaxID=1914328 RepID=UPI00260B41A5|nr:GNAT family N-acetyltransferase [Pseudooceanicola sp.]MDF1855597.1 GNAT family N-acetyltransferase [Pseudooceanicola sp.]